VFKRLFLAAAILLTGRVVAQEPEKILSKVYEDALTDQTAWKNLEYLCKNTKGRLAGSKASYKAIDFTAKALKEAGADTVFLQKVMVPVWRRGTEKCTVKSSAYGTKSLSVSALGLSVGTSPLGVSANVIEVHDFDELKAIGKEKITGKIVFFNRPSDNKLINTFSGYSGAVNQRSSGPSEASKLGAAAVIVRSVTQFVENFPHTGVTHYGEGVNPIPAVAVSTTDANYLSDLIKKDPSVSISLISTCRNFADTLSYNVVGEIRGSVKQNEVITVGGHIDSWDITEGAHDDAGGCVQAIEMIRIFKKLGIVPKRTIRAVMFMNEEMGGSGGKVYADEAKRKGEIAYAALESDRGVMSPRGFGFDADGDKFEKIVGISPYFLPYDVRDFEKGGGGTDIGPLKNIGAMLISYIPDSQRYFTFHHSANDTFEQVNIRELQMGSASIASLIFLVDLLDL
jgi:carboxypeptidase Q